MSKISEYLTARGYTFISRRKRGCFVEVHYRTPHGSIVPQRIALLYARQDKKAAKAENRAQPDICLDCDSSPCICLEAEPCER